MTALNFSEEDSADPWLYSLGLLKTSNRVGITLKPKDMLGTILTALMRFLSTVLGGL